MGRYIAHDHNRDGIDRRGFLECMAWAGTGLVWTAAGGVVTSRALGVAAEPAAPFTFVQISDSHIGFDKAANHDVVATLREAVRRVNASTPPPSFVIHTGDLTHLSRPDEFDTLDSVLQEMKAGRVFFVPGEHDVLDERGTEFLTRHGKGTRGNGWYSFDDHGIHFIGLVNVVDLRAGGLGRLGRDQLDWLARDVEGLQASTPVVVFAHIPLWTIYPQWGWGTDDSEQVLSHLKRFGSVTVLNGHIHQVMQKVEGRVTFHTAMSTAFPQPQPGTAPAPGPMTVPADRLRHVLGLTDVQLVKQRHALAIVDQTLAGA